MLWKDPKRLRATADERVWWLGLFCCFLTIGFLAGLLQGRPDFLYNPFVWIIGLGVAYISVGFVYHEVITPLRKLLKP